MKSVCRAGLLSVAFLIVLAPTVLAPPTYTTYQVTDNVDHDAMVDVALGMDGTPHAVYVRDGVLYYRMGLGAERNLGAVGTAAYPAIAVETDRVHIVHTDGVSGVHYQCRGFDGSVIGSDAIGSRSSWADVDVDSTGGVHIVYLDADVDGYADVMYVNNIGGAFINPTIVFDAQDINATGVCHYRWWYDRPAIKIDADGYWHIAAWHHFSEAGCGYAVYHAYGVVYKSTRDARDTATSDMGSSLSFGRNPLWVDTGGSAGIVFGASGASHYWDPGSGLAPSQFCTGSSAAISGSGTDAVIAYEDAILTGQVTYVRRSGASVFYNYTTIGGGAAPAVAVGSLYVYYVNSDGSDDEVYVYTDSTLTRSWSIAVSADPSAGGSVSGGGTYVDGSAVTVEATVSACYGFVNWTESGTEVSTSRRYDFTTTADRTLVANFVAVQVEIAQDVDPSEGGSVVGGGYYDCGALVEMIATPNLGYAFVNWTQNDVEVSTDAKYSFTAAAHRDDLVAHFQVSEFTLTVDVAPAGGGDVAAQVVQSGSKTTAARPRGQEPGTYPYQTRYPAGTTVRLEATASEGYEFDEFTGDTGAASPTAMTLNGGASGSAEVLMDRDRSITGNFTAIPKYTLTLDVSPLAGGNVTATVIPDTQPAEARAPKAAYPAIEYYEGTTVRLDATASPGYEFKEFVGNLDSHSTQGLEVGVPRGGGTGSTQVVMDEDRTVTVVFSAVSGLFYEDFADLTGWTATGLWHLRGDQAACFACGVIEGSFAYYARKGACDYATGARTTGTLTSPLIALAGAKNVELSFDYFRHVAPFYRNPFADITRAQVKLGRGSWQTVWSKSTWNKSPECGSFSTRISTSRVTTMQVRFVFDSMSRLLNTYPGWAIDNVTVRDAASGSSLSALALPDDVSVEGVTGEGLYVLSYPNPVRDVHTTTFAVRGADVEEIQVWIYDLDGHLVYEARGYGSELDWHTDASTGGFLANGIYIYAVDVLLGDEWVSFPLQTLAILK
jgi:hypothetical protein